MRTSFKIVAAALTAVAAWSAPSHAKPINGTDLGSLVPWSVSISNAANSGISATITIYDTNFNIMTTDCLQGGAVGKYSGSQPALEGIYIRFQLYTSPTDCQGSLLRDTSYGSELTDDAPNDHIKVLNFPPQAVPNLLSAGPGPAKPTKKPTAVGGVSAAP